MKNLRHLRIVALVAALAIPSAGCGLTFAGGVAVAGSAISVVQMLVTAIQGWERNYFTQNPNAAEQAKVEQAIATTLAADALAAQALQTTQDVKSAQVTQAFADVYVAYQDLLVLLRDAGVVTAPSGSNIAAEPLAGRLYVVSPDDLIPKGVDLPSVKARAQVMRAARAAQ